MIKKIQLACILTLLVMVSCTPSGSKSTLSNDANALANLVPGNAMGVCVLDLAAINKQIKNDPEALKKMPKALDQLGLNLDVNAYAYVTFSSDKKTQAFISARVSNKKLVKETIENSTENTVIWETSGKWNYVILKNNVIFVSDDLFYMVINDKTCTEQEITQTLSTLGSVQTPSIASNANFNKFISKLELTGVWLDANALKEIGLANISQLKTKASIMAEDFTGTYLWAFSKIDHDKLLTDVHYDYSDALKKIIDQKYVYLNNFNMKGADYVGANNPFLLTWSLDIKKMIDEALASESQAVGHDLTEDINTSLKQFNTSLDEITSALDGNVLISVADIQGANAVGMLGIKKGAKFPDLKPIVSQLSQIGIEAWVDNNTLYIAHGKTMLENLKAKKEISNSLSDGDFYKTVKSNSIVFQYLANDDVVSLTRANLVIYSIVSNIKSVEWKSDNNEDFHSMIQTADGVTPLSFMIHTLQTAMKK